MLALLSPAKTLDYDTPFPDVETTEPRFAEEAQGLAASAGRLGRRKLAEVMHISDTLAALNIARFRGFMEQPERPALYAFAGDVYTGLSAYTLDDDAVAFAQDHVRILSGLYGLLRPLDRIRPYRLEMGTRWAPRRRKLTDWWGARIADMLAQDVEAEGSAEILNLASQEYWAAADDRLPASVRIVSVDFREADGRFVSFHAKKARGIMARWLAEHRIDRIEGMQAFDSAGYTYDADASQADRWTFTR